MRSISKWILNHRKTVLALFLALSVVSVFCYLRVEVNYNMSDYLPEDAPSTVGLRLMQEEFNSEPANLRVLLENVSISEALSVKSRIADVPGVSDVTWLDDSLDVTTPIEMMDTDTVDAWYKDANALITAYVDTDSAHEALKAIREIIGEDNCMSGDSVQTDDSQSRGKREIAKMLAIIVPIILVILFLSTTSYIVPVLFLVTIGVAIILGKGSDIIFGEVSFITSTCSAILQLATSMDYAIFLLDSFEELKAKGMGNEEAMVEAMNKAFSSIISSSLTTVFGFLALTIMQFRIGFDMGLVLAKGIVLSLVCVLFLLPILTIYSTRVIDKQHHKPILPKFRSFSRVDARICVPVLFLLVAFVIAPSMLANQNNSFVYGMKQMLVDPQIRVVQDQNRIDELYEKSNQMVLIVPTGQPAREQIMIDRLNEIPEISSIIAYATKADTTLPIDFVGRENLTQLMSDNYSRMIISSNIEIESDRAFRLVEELRAIGEEFYPGENYLTGGTSNIYDMRDVVLLDDVRVNTASMAAIGIVLLFNFKSLSLPFILLSAIKASVYVNLAVPYFTSERIYYISTLIINAVQLGATVDYAILFTNQYMDNRRSARRIEAAEKTIYDTSTSILTSASILTVGGCMLGAMSSVDIIRQLGFLVGRGAVISASIVVIALPALLMLFEPLIRITTIGAKFYTDKRIRPSGNKHGKDDPDEKALDKEYRDFIACADDSGERDSRAEE
ncbi:RND family transporter [Bacillota bacterium Meth-B3]